jgi:O-antigen/teichoic acid export membrane protein
MEKDTKEINTGLLLLAKSSFIFLFGFLASKIFTYIYRVILARNFGPETYGIFSLATMVVGWFIAIFSLGLTEGVIKFISYYRGKKEFDKIRHLIGFSSFFLLISSLIAGVILFLTSELISIKLFHDSNLTIFLKIFSFLIPIWIFSNFFAAILSSFEQMSWYSFIVNILQNAVKVITLILFVLLGFSTNSIIFSFFLGILSMLIAGYLVCRHKIPGIFNKLKLKKTEKTILNKKLISYSWPVMFSGIIMSIFYWIDTFSIGFLKNATEVGFYNAAVPLVLFLLFAPELFLHLFFPMINRHFSQNKLEIIKELSQQVGKWIFLLNLPLFLIMVIFPGAIVNIFFGGEYLVAENALRILSIGYFVSGFYYIPGSILNMLGKSKLMLFNVLVTSVINFILNFILIPIYGINGAALSTSFVWIILTALTSLEAYHFTSIIPIRRKVFRIALISLIPLGIVLVLRKLVPLNALSLILIGAFFLLSYILLIFLTKCLDKNDFLVIKSVFKRFSKK